MANYDRSMESRVWKRVRSDQSPEGGTSAGELLGLIQAEQMAAANYLALARRMGPAGAPLQTIARQEQRHARCLRGIYIQITGTRPAVQPPKPENTPIETALRKSYAGELQSMAAYRARTADPEYGHVFASLAEQETEHSAVLLELLGNT